ncbi:MAG: C4-dicarboxylate ABC transporter [Gammaproteobacteria bacterium TMED278]|jgi:tripartite ATP-independent transporter DctM subunit|nr:C4-dicarboxylate ABC transporter [Gammaproteobacteria bacterium]OUX41619.1 MAG: C4-dicarboxylate ABC transporter [Gammaproteobacteria bacterium TMED278]|tara:strand:- start:22 stop:1398 length:1377 start_codon:yes stop_codon:yes gene_type:complete
MISPEILAIVMFVTTLGLLLFGFPVAFTLAGTALMFGFLGDALEIFNFRMLGFFPQRIFGTMINEPLVAVPLFIFMGIMLEKTKIAAGLLQSIGELFGSTKGGLGIGVVIVGMLLAASTGIVGATVVTMGMLSLPSMMKAGYDQKIATGTICAAGTLGQIIPPSIVLVLLATILQGANEEAAMLVGNLAPDPVTAIDLFAGAILPGLMLVVLFVIFIFFYARFNPLSCPPVETSRSRAEIYIEAAKSVIPPITLIILVLGSILFGIATPTESASVGAVGAAVIALLKGELSFKNVKETALGTVKLSSFVFVILIGASMFSLVFRGFGGDEMIEHFLGNLPGGLYAALILVMIVIFLLGFFLDYIEIIFVIVPLVGPILIANGADPLWLGILISLNLQTSFLTPPFGFSLFFLRGVAPNSIQTKNMYKGVIPFIGIQVLAIFIVGFYPEIATWLPNKMF